ncbi:hypothetical protein [Mucilaginibacter sp.]|uniref:hypothetical protein n=1 Tax=Mucilaginibacter sp. TaxID=1882438 RepID=UPI00261C40B4|nr:hypothetical protein [Mucilaginibacter sp.]MDB4925617.1 hypothetical protein [Mucilaginibacter sp.]
MKKAIVLTLLFLVTAMTVVAQVDPGTPACGGGDPDLSDCPLDSWVILLAGCGLIITVLYLNNKQKASRQLHS